MQTVEKQSGIGKYVIVYLCMLAIAAAEVAVAYQHIDGMQMVAQMMALVILGAGLGIMFFMNLATEKRSMIIAAAIFTLFVLGAINYGWTDSFRVRSGAPFSTYQ
jgi:cytochrome c oxidase subunit IV